MKNTLSDVNPFLHNVCLVGNLIRDNERIRVPQNICLCLFIYIFLTAIGLTPGGSSPVHIYTQTVHRIQRTEHT
jgi:hypothetical protein